MGGIVSPRGEGVACVYSDRNIRETPEAGVRQGKEDLVAGA